MLVSFFLFFSLLFSSAFASDSIQVVIGGGAHSKKVLEYLKQKIAEKHGGVDATRSLGKVLFLGWASSIPEEYSADLKAELNDGLNGGRYELIPSFIPPNRYPKKLRAAAKKIFLENAKKADVIYISGGNQKKLMAGFSDPEVETALKLANEATPLVTTSASTAALGTFMITGDSTPLAKGMGFIPGFITEQHYLVSQKHFKPGTKTPIVSHAERESRVIRAMEDSNLNRAMAVAEDGAVVITNQKNARVLGNRPVVFYELKGQQLLVHQMSDGQEFDLENWKPKNVPHVSCFNLQFLFSKE